MDKQYGGWYDNPATGKNQRWFNGTWTDGAEPSSGGSSSSSDISIPRLDPINYGDAVKEATDMFGDTTTGVQNQLQGVVTNIGTHSKDKHDALLALEPTIKELYGNLSKQLEMQYQDEANTAKGQKAADIGKQRADAAAQGFTSASGFEAAQERNTQAYYDAQISRISEKWGLKKEQLVKETEKSIKEIVVEAKDALINGDIEQAKVLGEIASIRLEQANLINEAANRIAHYKLEIGKANQSAAGAEITARLQKEANDVERIYKDRLMNLQERQFELTAKKAATSGASDLAGFQGLLSMFGIGGDGGETSIEDAIVDVGDGKKEDSASVKEFKSWMGNVAPGWEDLQKRNDQRVFDAGVGAAVGDIKVDLSGIRSMVNPNKLQIGK